MYSKTGNVHIPGTQGVVRVQPDRARVAVRVKVAHADPTTVPRALERALAQLERAVDPAVVLPVGYRSSSDTPSGKRVFGGTSQTIGETTCRVDLTLADDDGYIARAAALEDLRTRLARVELDGASLAVGEGRFVLADAEAHRVAATEALHGRLREAASACGMTLARLELETGLGVEVAGPCEAYVSVSGRAHFSPTS